MNLMKRRKVLNILSQNKSLVALVLLLAVATVRYDGFLTIRNISNILVQSSINGIISVGMMLVIVLGGIDLSVGAVAALAAVTSAQLINSSSLLVAVLLPIFIGMTVGFISGILIVKLDMNAFIATLSTQFFARGLTHVLSESKNVTVDKTNEAFTFIGSGKIFGVVPVQVIIFLVVILVMGFILTYTSYGRCIYAIGGNKEAAKMMGARVDKNTVIAYIISGGLAALAGIILCARLGSGQPTSGIGYETDAIAAVVMGGTLLTGGWGTMRGTFMGIITLSVINNILNLEGNLSSWWQDVILGTLVLIIIIAQSSPRRSRAIKQNKAVAQRKG